MNLSERMKAIVDAHYPALRMALNDDVMLKLIMRQVALAAFEAGQQAVFTEFKRIMEEERVDRDKLPRFPHTYCSNCGKEFGPGDHGYSYCESHAHLVGRD